MFESDENLVDQIRMGKNREAGETLVGKYYKKVYKIVYIKTSDEELSKDLTQEVFISVLKNLNQFNPEKASFKTWLMRIADHKIIDYLRSRRHHEEIMTEILEDYDQEDTRNVENQIVNQLASERITEVLRTYGPDLNKIVTLKVNDGHTFDEIGKITGNSKATVKSKYYSAMKKMRKELSDYE